jgi:hypothetical protein
VERLFLYCFVFGAGFALLSTFLSIARLGGHGGHHSPTASSAARGPLAAGHGTGSAVHHAHGLTRLLYPTLPHAHGTHLSIRANVARVLVPLINMSSFLAFLTWFGAVGYLLTAKVGLPAFVALPPAFAAGLGAALLIGWFLVKVMAGERVMDPRDFQLPGTYGRVTVRIPAGGVGEVQFSKGGVWRGEAARSLSGQALARGTEVVIIRYGHGVADVLTLDEFTSTPAPQQTSQGGSLRVPGD